MDQITDQKPTRWTGGGDHSQLIGWDDKHLSALWLARHNHLTQKKNRINETTSINWCKEQVSVFLVSPSVHRAPSDLVAPGWPADSDMALGAEPAAVMSSRCQQLNQTGWGQQGGLIQDLQTGSANKKSNQCQVWLLAHMIMTGQYHKSRIHQNTKMFYENVWNVIFWSKFSLINKNETKLPDLVGEFWLRKQYKKQM